MAATKTETAPAPEAGAAAPGAPATPAATTPPAPGGGFKAWLPLVITVLVMPVLAYAMTAFVLVPRVQKGLGINSPAAGAETEKKKGPASAKKEAVTMNKLLVNVSGTMGARYLLVSLSLVGTDPDFKTKLADAESQLRDMACGALASKTLADLEKPGARNLIRSELISGFNNVLGGPAVQEIYLTEFAIQ
jgi:flagellar FliL protein